MFPDLALYPWPAIFTALIIALVVSTLGFRRADWFISVSYGLSIAAQAVVFPLLLWGRWDIWAGLQALLLVVYGVRLTTHIVTREKKSAYASRMEGSAMRSDGMKMGMKATMWISVALLYVLMYSPALMTLNAQAQGANLASLPFGLIIMAIGLFMEGVGDWQKSAAKEKKPNDFVSTGLYRIVRFPNYLGEMLFWIGVWVSGISAYASVLDWIVASIGILSIQGVMIGSARGLEKKQNERYGERADYQAYVKKTPILFPFLPLYSLARK